MTEFSIRPAGPEKAHEVFAIQSACFTQSISIKDVENNLQNPITRCLGLYRGDEMIGFGAFWMLMEEAHVTHVAIRSEYRGQGLGKMLMAALIQHASDTGARFMELEVRRTNLTALSLYHKLGFLRVGLKKGYYPDTGEDAVVMALIAMPAPNEENDPFLTAE